MKRLIDTNVWIYAYQPESSYYSWAREVLSQSISSNEAYINPMILSELCVGDASPKTLISRIRNLGVHLLDIPPEVSPIAAAAFSKYLIARNTSDVSPAPKTPLPDFFIGAHASLLDFAIATVDTQR